MKKLFSIFLLFSFHISFSQTRQDFDFNKIYSFVLQGDMGRVLSILDTLPYESLSSHERDIKEKFYRRFKFEDENESYNTDDPMIRDLLKIYRTYWRKALLANGIGNEYENQLKSNVITFLEEHDYSFLEPDNTEVPSGTDIENNFALHLKNFLLEQGYNCATGKTAGFYDLLIWCTELPTEYDVELLETEITTTVVFLRDIISLGWEEYATFEKYYPGGWATKELLYVVQKAYDTTSEKFHVSYLKHESQHFADYKNYPLLSGADLEYRAKLTELIYAEETLYSLIRSFIRNSSSADRNPHPFGSYVLIRNLSSRIFGTDNVDDMEQWKSIPAKKIKQESKKLLLEHSSALERACATSVVELIN